jgi:hypothetical protein
MTVCLSCIIALVFYFFKTKKKQKAVSIKEKRYHISYHLLYSTTLNTYNKALLRDIQLGII